MRITFEINDVTGWISRVLIYAKDQDAEIVAWATLRKITTPGVFTWLRRAIRRRVI